MANVELRNQMSKLFNPETFEELFESYDRVIGSAIKLSESLALNKDIDGRLHDAEMLFQMTQLKALSIKNLASKVQYQSDNLNIEIGPLSDPFSIWPLVRCQYEGFCAFNHIYIHPKTIEEKEFIYKLWVISGLKYRQEFDTRFNENITKKKEELKLIDTLIDEVKVSSLYKELGKEEQEKINKAIKNKQWQFFFHDRKFIFASWKKMVENARVKPETFAGVYSFLSLSAHPSNVSIFQFRQIHYDNSSDNISFFALSLSIKLMCFLVYDYYTYKPEIKNIFETLPIENQILINFFNRVFREDSFSINNIEDHI